MADKGPRRYGEIVNPEKRASVEKERYGLRAVMSAYRIFRSITGKAAGDSTEESRFWGEPIAEELYAEACSLLEDYGDMELDGAAAVGNLRKAAGPYDGTGIYLSALLNMTGMAELVLDRFPDLDHIGYRIQKGKILVLGEDVKCFSLGIHASGTVLNFGDAALMAEKAAEGVQANWEKAYSMANESSGGIQINMGKMVYMAMFSHGGFQGNWSTVNHNMAGLALGGIQYNCGFANDYAAYSNGGIQINWEEARQMGFQAYDGKQLNGGRISGERGQSVLETDQGLLELDKKLNERVAEFDLLYVRGDPDESLLRTRHFDFGEFERDMRAIGKEIEEYVRRRYG